MTEYVALLRGINVGRIRIAMADLRAEFESLGLDDVATVLASGNVLFSAATTDPRQLRALIEPALTARFAYPAVVFVHPRAAVRAVVEHYPFADEADRHSYVVFVADDEIRAELITAAVDLDADVERVADGPGVVYWQVTKSMTLSSAFGTTIGRSRYRTTTTNRNLRTLRTVVG